MSVINPLEFTETGFLGGQRFNPLATQQFKVPVEQLPYSEHYDDDGNITRYIDFASDVFLNVVTQFINDHQTFQLPRLKELKRYYMNNNNIKFIPGKSDEYRANNKIASDFVRFVTTFKRGVVVGNPVEYNSDERLTDLIMQFSDRNNESLHNQQMVQDMVLFGRAYELITRDKDANERVHKLDVETCFVVYDTSVDKNSVFAVRYFDVEFLGEFKTHIEVYGNDGNTYYFECPGLSQFSNMKLIEVVQTYTNAVNINEWNNNEEGQGDCDPILDSIDAYDLAQSELANFMQDASDAYLVIRGNPLTAEGTTQKQTLKEMRQARMLILGDKIQYDSGAYGSDPDAYYLTKKYDSAGAEAYKERLVSDILRFSFVVDFTDETLGSNQTGIGMRFKGWGNDNDRKTKENAIKKALMRRLRILASSWAVKETIDPKNLAQTIGDLIKNVFVTTDRKQSDLDTFYDLVNEVTIKFTPNIPRSDTEIVENSKNLYGIISNKTLFELLEPITGVDTDAELERLKEQLDDEETLPEPTRFEQTNVEEVKQEVTEDGEE